MLPDSRSTRILLLKLFIGLILGIFLPRNSSAQFQLSRINFEFSAGSSIPMRAFGDKTAVPSNDTINLSGYATTGYHFSLSAGSLLFSENFGLLAKVGLNINFLDDIALGHALNNPYSTVSTTDPYFAWQYMAGPMVLYFINEKLGIGGHILLGQLYISHPMEYQDIKSPGLSFNLDYQPLHGSGFVYSLGLKCIRKITTNASLFLDADYSASDVIFPKYTMTLVGTNGTIIPGPSTRTFNSTEKMTLGILQISLGIQLHF